MPHNRTEKAPNVSLTNFATATLVERCRIVSAISNWEGIPIRIVCEFVRTKTGVFVDPEDVKRCRSFIPTNHVGNVGSQVSFDSSHSYPTYYSPLCGDRMMRIHRRKVK